MNNNSKRFGSLIAVCAALAVTPLAFGATRTFDFQSNPFPENPAFSWGTPDELCSVNTVIPPLFNRPGYGIQTKSFVDGDPTEPMVLCDQGAFGTGLLNFGNDALLTGTFYYGGSGAAEEIRFSWVQKSEAPITISGAAWVEATKTLTAAGAFADFIATTSTAKLIRITGGTGVTPGLYAIASRTDADSIVLATSIGPDATDVAGTIDVQQWARLYTFKSGAFPTVVSSPIVHFGPGSSIEMKVLVYGVDDTVDEIPTAAEIEMCPVIRETGQNLPLGAAGATDIYPLEWVGVDASQSTNATPIGGVMLLADPFERWYTVKYEFGSDPTKVTVTVTLDGETPVVYTKDIAAFTGDGSLSAANSRGTFDSLAFRKSPTDVLTKKWSIVIDDVILNAPGIEDPVQVVGPIIAGDTTVKVSTINPAATAVKLYRDINDGNGLVLLDTQNPAGALSYDFTITAAVKNHKYAATQVVGGSESGMSDSITVQSAVVFADNFDYDTATYNARWTKTTGDVDLVQSQDQAASCPNAAKELACPTGTSAARRYLDLIEFTDPPMKSVNGTDEKPLWITWYFRHEGPNTGQRNFIQFCNYNDVDLGGLSHQYHFGTWNASTPPVTNTSQYQARDNYDGGPNWFVVPVNRINNAWVKCSIKLTATKTQYWINDALALETARFGPTEGISTIILGSGMSNNSAAAWYDNITISYGANPTDEFGPPLKGATVNSPLRPGDTSVTVSGIDNSDTDGNPKATAVTVYVDGTPVATEAVDGTQTSKVMTIPALLNNQQVSATQTIDGVESCRIGAVTVQVATPTVQGPLLKGGTSVTVNGVTAGATVKLYINDVFRTDIVAAGSSVTFTSLSPALDENQVVKASQVINGDESPKSAGVVVVAEAVGPIRMAIILKEVDYAGTPAFGVSAGNAPAGTLEVIGAQHTSSHCGGKLITPGGGWQTLTFKRNEGLFAFMSGNGVLSSPDDPWFAIEGFAITAGDLSEQNAKLGPYTLYVDNIVDGDPPAVGAIDFDAAPYTLNGTGFTLRPGATTHLNVAGANPVPSCTISDAAAYTGSWSTKYVWRWTQTASELVTGSVIDPDLSHSWFRTYSSNTPIPYPLIDVGTAAAPKNIYVHVLLCGAPSVSIGNILGEGGTVVHVSNVSLSADTVNVYAGTSLLASAPTNGANAVDVDVPALTSGQSISATQVIAGAESCYSDAKVVGACNQVASPRVGGPLVGGQTTVTVIDCNPNADSVSVYVNGSLAGSNPGGDTTVTVGVAALTAGQSITVTQVLEGVESCPSGAALVGDSQNAGLLLTLGVRESDGDIEFVGAGSKNAAGAPQGKQIVPLGEWQTISFSAADPMVTFSAGDGILNPPVTLEHLAIAVDATDPGSGPFVMYIDNIMNGTTPLQGFESSSVGAEVFFQEPTFSGTTFPSNLLSAPAVSAVDGSVGDNSSRSLRVEWQFIDASPNRWLRLTTNLLNPPTVDLTQGVSMRILLVPVGAQISQWSSVKTHAGSPQGIALDKGLAADAATIEPRQGGVDQLELTFSGTVTGTPDVAVAGPGGPYTAVVTGSGATRSVAISPALQNGACYTFTLSAGTVSETLIGDLDCCVRTLAGDMTGNATVNLGDVLYAKTKLGQALPAFDYDLSGAVDAADLAAIKALVNSPAAGITCP